MGLGSSCSSTAPQPECSRVSVQLEELPPELLMMILAHLDALSLAALRRCSRHLCAIASDPSLWRLLPMTLFNRPRPPIAPASLPCIRVCSYRWPSPQRARDALAWLGRLGPVRVRRLELVGKGIDKEVLVACSSSLSGVKQLSLHEVRVENAWLEALSQFRLVQVIWLDWLSVMTCDQVERLAAACPELCMVVQRTHSPHIPSQQTLQHALEAVKAKDCRTGKG